ncbi:nitroreductase [Chryseobacterium sp.]|uniref:nitroreductase family protein n=1 Tax=Chryseobacterium sp. TaxID=1871047 RepID=UPI0011C9D465|nr:nitroreductase [Chryseobacterium sp.]TXF77482.1 nitroreductase [Chryseobacterium sp.]
MNQAEILKHIIQSRKSTFPKDYTSDEIPQPVLEEITSSAHFAPNHKKTKPWRLRVFKGLEKTELGEQLAQIYKETTPPEVFLEKKYFDIAAKISKANAVITISVNFSGLLPEWEEVAATAMAVQNMYLTCTANNVGCYWSTPGMMKHLDRFLGLEENQKCYGLFYLGMKKNED